MGSWLIAWAIAPICAKLPRHAPDRLGLVRLYQTNSEVSGSKFGFDPPQFPRAMCAVRQ